MRANPSQNEAPNRLTESATRIRHGGLRAALTGRPEVDRVKSGRICWRSDSETIDSAPVTVTPRRMIPS